MLACAAAVLLQRVRQVVGVLPAQLGVAGIDRRIAVGAVAVDAALAGGLALGGGSLLASGDATGRQAGRGTRLLLLPGFRGGGPVAAGAGGTAQGGGQAEGGTRGVHGVRHGQRALT